MSKSSINKLVLLFYLILASGAISGLYRLSGFPWSSAMIILMLMYILLNVKNIISSGLKYNKVTLYIFFYAALFCFTSIDVPNSILSLLSILIMILFAQCSVNNDKNIIRSIRNILGVLIFASSIAAILVPSVGLQESGEWRGLFETKNVFARICIIAMGIILFDSQISLARRVILYLLLCLVVVKTNSDTAIFMTVFMPLAFVFLSRKGIANYAVKLIPLYIFIVWLIITPLMITAGGTLNDLTNGRQVLWSLLAGYNQNREILGWGFNSFWTPEMVNEIGMAVYWPASNAHNIVLDSYLDSGILGTVIVFLIFATANLSLRRNDTIGWVVLLLCIGLSITENTFLRPNSILLFILFCHLEHRRSHEDTNFSIRV